MNRKQCSIYHAIIHITKHKSRSFFIDRPGGISKTFLYNTLLVNVRSREEIAMAVAFSGIAALLISDGKTAYSRFKILIKLNESSTCNILQNSKKACLINMVKLFIWDEALMMHKFAFKAINQTFHDITQVDEPFEGKTFIFGGNFHQVLLQLGILPNIEFLNTVVIDK